MHIEIIEDKTKLNKWFGSQVCADMRNLIWFLLVSCELIKGKEKNLSGLSYSHLLVSREDMGNITLVCWFVQIDKSFKWHFCFIRSFSSNRTCRGETYNRLIDCWNIIMWCFIKILNSQNCDWMWIEIEFISILCEYLYPVHAYTKESIYNLVIKSVVFILYMIMSYTWHLFVFILALLIRIHRVYSVIDYIEAKYPLRVNTIIFKWKTFW